MKLKRDAPYFEIHLLEGNSATPVDSRQSKKAAVALARLLLKQHGFNYRVCRVDPVYTTVGDPACAQFKLEDT